MSVRINWTTESEKTFNQNLDYLSKEWDLLVLNDFLDRVEKHLISSDQILNYFHYTDRMKMCTDV